MTYGCDQCGGRLKTYCTKRTGLRVTRYYRCDDCHGTAKTSNAIDALGKEIFALVLQVSTPDIAQPNTSHTIEP